MANVQHPQPVLARWSATACAGRSVARACSSTSTRARARARTRQAYLEIDQNALDYDGTTWWCTETSKTIGPDDRPCDETRCGSSTKRACYRGEEPVA